VSLQDWLAILAVASTAISSIVLWGFLTGRWIQKQEGESSHGQKRIAEIESDIHELDRALRDADLARHAFVERVNIDVGRLEQRIALVERADSLMSAFNERRDQELDRRLGQMESILREIQREGHR
jgi:hypothetical protein